VAVAAEADGAAARHGRLLRARIYAGQCALCPDDRTRERRPQGAGKEVDQLRAAGKPTLPTSIGLELETNPFLRPHVAAIQQRLGMVGRPAWQIFAEIRERKNRS
jgi:hypothetical protein